jgi:crotonobetainyl-CoA:carnitine CoA-transferase CaiB-like acyl-CoA transferase
VIEENIARIQVEAGIPPVPVRIAGNLPILPSIYRVDEIAVASVGGATAAVAALWAARGGPPAQATVDVRHAVLAFQSERFLRIAGQPINVWAPLSGDYRTRDGWVRLHCNFDHHRDAVLKALDCPAEEVAAACAARTSIEIESLVLAAGGAAAAMRTRDEWAAFPSGALVGLSRIADSPAVRLGPATRPLDGVRVLDLTRVIAGPVATRILAAYGADVLRVGAAHVPEVPGLVMDMSLGKRSCHLNLRTEDGRARLRDLVADADVLIQGYRPGAVTGLGFGPAELTALNPGLVTVDVSAYEAEGPWGLRRGFDSLVQMATGIAYEGMVATGSGKPFPLPAQALDHATGYLGAFAAVAGLLRRSAEGGAWHGRVSLARTARWLDSLGRVDRLDVVRPEADDLMASLGELTFIRPPGLVHRSEPHWDLAPKADGSDAAQWA